MCGFDDKRQGNLYTFRNQHHGQVYVFLLSFPLFKNKRQRALFFGEVLICVNFTPNEKLFNIQRNLYSSCIDFCHGFNLWNNRDVVRHSHFTPKQLRLPVIA